jgi:hypothetical protein
VKKNSQKLSLTKETLKQLTGRQLERVGGARGTHRHCHNTDACPSALNTCTCLHTDACPSALNTGCC